MLLHFLQALKVRKEARGPRIAMWIEDRVNCRILEVSKPEIREIILKQTTAFRIDRMY